jgi:parvulin-like peptidyl-prolyl isomerase
VDKRYPDPQTGRERIKYHEIAIRVNPGPEAIRSGRAQVAEIGKEAKRDGLVAVATRRGLRTFESEFFAQGRSRNNIFAQLPEVEQWVFTGKVGSVSAPVPTQTAWYYYQILDRRKAGLRPLESVQEQARHSLIRSLATAKAEAAATQARAAILAGMKEEDAARRFRGAPGRAEGVTRNGFIPAVGQDPRTVGTLYAMVPQTWSPVLTGPLGAIIGYVEGRTTPSEAEFQTQAPTLRQNLLNERRQVTFTEWMQELRRKAKIVDYRENYFEA